MMREKIKKKKKTMEKVKLVKCHDRSFFHAKVLLLKLNYRGSCHFIVLTTIGQMIRKQYDTAIHQFTLRKVILNIRTDLSNSLRSSPASLLKSPFFFLDPKYFGLLFSLSEICFHIPLFSIQSVQFFTRFITLSFRLFQLRTTRNEMVVAYYKVPIRKV